MEKSLKMKQFNHPNIMNLIGVCMAAGPAPYIVMPFMANGSLLSYLRKERSNLLLDETADEDLVRVIWKKKTGNTNDVEQSKAAHATQFQHHMHAFTTIL